VTAYRRSAPWNRLLQGRLLVPLVASADRAGRRTRTVSASSSTPCRSCCSLEASSALKWWAVLLARAAGLGRTRPPVRPSAGGPSGMSSLRPPRRHQGISVSWGHRRRGRIPHRQSIHRRSRSAYSRRPRTSARSGQSGPATLMEFRAASMASSILDRSSLRAASKVRAVTRSC